MVHGRVTHTGMSLLKKWVTWLAVVSASVVVSQFDSSHILTIITCMTRMPGLCLGMRTQLPALLRNDLRKTRATVRGTAVTQLQTASHEACTDVTTVNKQHKLWHWKVTTHNRNFFLKIVYDTNRTVKASHDPAAQQFPCSSFFPVIKKKSATPSLPSAIMLLTLQRNKLGCNLSTN